MTTWRNDRAQLDTKWHRAFRFAIRIDSNRITKRLESSSFVKKIGLSTHNFRVLYNE